MRCLPVVLQLRTGCPVQREVADLSAHARVVRPGCLGYIVRGKPALVRHHLVQRDVGFAAAGELRQVIGDLVHEGQPALLDQSPDGGTRQHLGLAEQQEQRVIGRRLAGGFDRGVAIGPEQRKLAVPGQGDLRARIAAVFDMLLDQPIEMLERLGGKAEARGLAGRQRIFGRHRVPPGDL
jgi:hypothetical protein